MNSLTGTGLGLRNEFVDDLILSQPEEIDFLEVAPENWINVGGAKGKLLRQYTERFQFVTHGLSLSIGGPDPLDMKLLKDIKHFLKLHNITIYTDHLSYCSNKGHLYDLMPIPFTTDAVNYVADRIHQVQDYLEFKIALENPSYYCAPGQMLEEVDFINAILQQGDCNMLLDVNNIYVNSVNHHYNAKQFIDKLDPKNISYIHVAGHYYEKEDFIIDSHGANVIDPVWDLLSYTYKKFGLIPTLLERDFNVPPLEELIQEVKIIRELQQSHCENVELKYA